MESTPGGEEVPASDIRGPAPVPVPPDGYRLTEYEGYGEAGATSRFSLLKFAPDESADVQVLPGRTTELAVGSPLTGKIIAKRESDRLRLRVEWTDAGGEEYGLLTAIGSPFAWQIPAAGRSAQSNKTGGTRV